MNGSRDPGHDTFRNFLLMAELEDGEPMSQREIARRVGVALGLVNAYLKTLVNKGYVTVKAYPGNRYAYLLTPKGLAEKSRLAYRHLHNFHKLYRATRQDSLESFRALCRRRVERVSFCGLDDLTEIAYLSLQEAGLALAVVMDETVDTGFLHFPVVPLEEGIKVETGAIVITSLRRADRLREALLRLGVEEGMIQEPSFSFEAIVG